MGEKESATAQDLGVPASQDAETARSRTGNMVHLDDDRGEARSTIQDFEKPTAATTVKSGKSNSSDRSGKPDAGGATQGTTKSSKSHSSE